MISSTSNRTGSGRAASELMAEISSPRRATAEEYSLGLWKVSFGSFLVALPAGESVVLGAHPWNAKHIRHMPAHKRIEMLVGYIVLTSLTLIKLLSGDRNGFDNFLDNGFAVLVLVRDAKF